MENHRAAARPVPWMLLFQTVPDGKASARRGTSDGSSWQTWTRTAMMLQSLREVVPSEEDHFMRNQIRGLVYGMLLAAASAAFSFPAAAQEIPQQLQAPANEQLLLQVHAKGDQVYTCKGDGAQFIWTLKAPDAQLFDKDGKPFGRHFAGPSWEANDGSRVVGKAVANVPSPDADSIPWLLVTVVSHDGSGVLSRVTTIQRLDTKGGKAPASGCDASHAGQEVRVAYSADYRFYVPK
jgi:Protein of unknown function (DUF3455)